MDNNKGDYKTPDYIRKSQNKYREKFDMSVIRLPKGTTEIIREKTGKSINKYINELVAEDLKKNYKFDITE